MSRLALNRRIAVIAAALAFIGSQRCLASAFVMGAYYRLGDADPGAVAGAMGNDPTKDSFGTLDLARCGSPFYSDDVPALGPVGNKLSMAFGGIGTGGPATADGYAGATLPTVPQGIELEAWVKSPAIAPAGLTGEGLIAYNGEPTADGFGFFVNGDKYVAHIGPSFEEALGPIDRGNWHHLAYVFSLGTSSYYYDGKLVATSTADPAPLATTAGFWIGGMPSAGAERFPLSGWVDEVRFQSFNPIAAGAFEPTAFLITPEPGALGAVALAVLVSMGRAFRVRARTRQVAPRAGASPSPHIRRAPRGSKSVFGRLPSTRFDLSPGAVRLRVQTICRSCTRRRRLPLGTRIARGSASPGSPGARPHSRPRSDGPEGVHPGGSVVRLSRG
jgi:hypothetical protein